MKGQVVRNENRIILVIDTRVGSVFSASEVPSMRGVLGSALVPPDKHAEGDVLGESVFLQQTMGKAGKCIETSPSK